MDFIGGSRLLLTSRCNKKILSFLFAQEQGPTCCFLVSPMSPSIAVSEKHSESGTARFLGSASSGILELLLFHPVDTVAKRLMSNQSRVSHCTLFVDLQIESFMSARLGLWWRSVLF